MSQLTGILADFISELQNISSLSHSDTHIIQATMPLMQDLVATCDWLPAQYFDYDQTRGYTAYLIHEEHDHRLQVNIVTWRPNFELPPHDHGTWAILGILMGVERNVIWRRLDDGATPGYAEIVQEDELLIQPGEVIVLGPHEIHSVKNMTDDIGVSIHIYGMNLNYTGRSQFNPAEHIERPYLIEFK